MRDDLNPQNLKTKRNVRFVVYNMLSVTYHKYPFLQYQVSKIAYILPLPLKSTLVMTNGAIYGFEFESVTKAQIVKCYVFLFTLMFFPKKRNSKN